MQTGWWVECSGRGEVDVQVCRSVVVPSLTARYTYVRSDTEKELNDCKPVLCRVCGKKKNACAWEGQWRASIVFTLAIG